MKSLTPQLLRNWQDCWRFPALWATACHRQEVSVDAAAKSLIACYAAPIGPEQVWRELLANREIKAAEELLDHPPFLAELKCSPDRLRSELRQERQRIYERLDARCHLILERTRRLHERTPPFALQLEEIQRVGREDPRRAGDLLSRLESDLAEREAKRVAELREQLARASQEPSRSGWRESVSRLLDACEIEMVDSLLGNLAGSPPMTAHADLLTRPPVWPYRAPLQLVCLYLREPEKAVFPFDPYRWAPPQHDLAAWSLIGTLETLLSELQATSPETVAQLGSALGCFFGGEPAGDSSPAEARDGFLWTSIRGISSPWLPALAARHGRDLPLAVPDPRAVAMPKIERLADLIILFDPWEVIGELPAGALGLSPELLFRCMPDRRSRLTGLLFELGRKVPLEQALPAILPAMDRLGTYVQERDGLALRYLVGRPDEASSSSSFQEIRALLSIFFDVLGVPPDRPESLDRLAYYCGQRAAVRHGLLRKILVLHAEQRGRRGKTDRTLIEEAWRAPDFRTLTRDFLLAPVHGDPLLLLTLSVLIYEISPLGGHDSRRSLPLDALAETVETWRQLASEPFAPLSRESLLGACAQLCHFGLVKEGAGKEEFSLDLGAAEGILTEEMLELGIEDHILRVAQALSSSRS